VKQDIQQVGVDWTVKSRH